MMAQTPEELLDEAARILATDPNRAYDLTRQVTNFPTSPSWSRAHADLAWHELGQGNHERALEHAEAVLTANPELVDPAALAAAGVLASNILDFLQRPVDEELLRTSINGCITGGQLYHAALGLGHLAHLRLSTGDRPTAKSALEMAVVLYDQIGSDDGGPRSLLRLATMAAEDGDADSAVAYIDRAISHLEQLPLRGRSARITEDKLRKLRSTIRK